MDNEIIKIHVWELPEKVDDIDTSEYIIIHDGYTVKKTTVEKLFKYLAQEYKVDNTIRYFDILIETENKKYDELYFTLENSIESYGEIINKLEESFTTNRNNIRTLETSMNQMKNNIDSISETFDTVDKKCNNLSIIFENIDNTVSDYEIRRNTLNSNIDKLNQSIPNIVKAKDHISSNNKHIVETADRVLSDIDTQTENNREQIISDINTVYDRVLSILDHYHHIET